MLNNLFIIFLILFGVSALLTYVFLLIGIIANDDFLTWSLFTLVITVLFGVGVMFTAPKKSHKCSEPTVVEYNSKEYTLDYKIVAYSNKEQNDTIYIITQKN